MKHLLYYAIGLAMIASSQAQVRPTPYHWQTSINVVDETSNPVVGAEVAVAFALPSKENQKAAEGRITGLTDTNGMFSTSGTSRSLYLSFQAQKAGYYPFNIQRNVEFSGTPTIEKSATNITLILKHVKNPIPMYAKSVNLGMPAFEKPVGFDLESGDWVAPYGKGTQADMIFIARLNQRSEGDSDYRLTISFPNPGDGIQEFNTIRLPVGEGSLLRSPHEAPKEGYQPEWTQSTTRKLGQPEQTNRDSERNYFFRVRTRLDEAGKVKTAQYGKIYRDFLQFRYYLNPNPNDRNVEFNPQRNLMHGLKSFEQVREP